MYRPIFAILKNDMYYKREVGSCVSSHGLKGDEQVDQRS